MTGTIRRLGDPGALCVCREEQCYCGELVPANGQACAACAEGRHVWIPLGRRDGDLSLPDPAPRSRFAALVAWLRAAW